MKKILITGSSGFIGSHLSEGYKEKYQIYSHDIKTLNLLDSRAVFEYLEKMNFDVVIHTATWSDRNLANKPIDVLANNLNMFFNLARNHDCFGKLIYYGSGAEYDRFNLVPKATEDFFNIYIPESAYGLSKFIMAQHTAVSTNIFELIPFAVFGPGEDWRTRFISNACCRDIFDLPITIMKNVVYDYIYVEDLVKITEWFINNTPPEHSYNVCYGQPYDLYSLAQMVQKYSGKGNQIIIQDQGMGHEYSGDNSKLLKLIPDIKFTKIEDAIASVYQWYLANKQYLSKDELSFNSFKNSMENKVIHEDKA
jgi:GDP-L-fucose synthase